MRPNGGDELHRPRALVGENRTMMAAGGMRIWLRTRRCLIVPAAQSPYTVAVDTARALATSATVSNLRKRCSSRSGVRFVRCRLGTWLGTNGRLFGAIGC